MTSPATSPPPGLSLSLPKKRPPLALPGSSGSQLKRRKPSTASASSHPLRQTSFPPPDRASSNQPIYSPTQSLDQDFDDDDLDEDVVLPRSGQVSARTSVTAGPASSLAGVSMRGTSTTRGQKRGRGRPRGSGRGGRRATGTASVVSGDDNRGVRAGSAREQNDDNESDGGNEEDVGGPGADNDDMLGGAAGRERLERDKESRAMFLSALLSLSQDGTVAVPNPKAGHLPTPPESSASPPHPSAGEAEAIKHESPSTPSATAPSSSTSARPDLARRKRKVQEMASVNASRYELWNRIHLKKEVVRRLTNQTLSQSVPGSVVTAINAYAKVFAGEIVSGALRVQEEWTAARLAAPQDEAVINGRATPSAELKVENGVATEGRATEKIDHAEKTNDVEGEVHEGTVEKRGWTDLPEEHIGPLLADHLRESLRRYKASREGGVVGFTGMSLEGRENTAARNAGRRLFR